MLTTFKNRRIVYVGEVALYEDQMTYRLPTVWSAQQKAVINWINTSNRSVIVEAVAGSGKTTTLLAAVKASKAGNIAIMAFNKKIADEINAKLIDLKIDWKHASAGTVHSFGFKALRTVVGNFKVDEKKVSIIVGAVPFASVICKIISLAKQRAVGVETAIDDTAQYMSIIEHFNLVEDEEGFDVNEIVKASIEGLKASNQQTAVIDFDDMVYLPLILPVKFWKYDTIIIDEAQDTNPARRLLAAKMLKVGGRVAAIGDGHQAIYGFTGADNDSLDLLAKRFNAIRLPLTVTYRCPKAVVNFARQWVNHIVAFEGNIEGEVNNQCVAFEKFTPVQSSAILCRNTAPLVKGAFKLLRRNIPCAIEGRDIAKGIIKLINKWKTVKTIDAYENKLETYYNQQKAKLSDKRLDLLADQVETIKVIIEQAQKDGKKLRTDLVDCIENLFSDNVKGVVTLSTIHKSKGREWNTVYWLNRSTTCPSKYAEKEWEMDQEINLMYVAATRAQERLLEVTI